LIDSVWIIGVGFTLFLAFFSGLARRRWSILYWFTILVGIGAGMLLVAWPDWLRQVWWLALLCYVVVVPVWKLSSRPSGPGGSRYVT